MEVIIRGGSDGMRELPQAVIVLVVLGVFVDRIVVPVVILLKKPLGRCRVNIEHNLSIAEAGTTIFPKAWLQNLGKVNRIYS